MIAEVLKIMSVIWDQIVRDLTWCEYKVSSSYITALYHHGKPAVKNTLKQMSIKPSKPLVLPLYSSASFPTVHLAHYSPHLQLPGHAGLLNPVSSQGQQEREGRKYL